MPDSLLVILRAVLAYAALLALTRMIGKRQVSQLTFFDYIVGITIGSMASTAVVELEYQFVSAMTGVLTWAILTVLIAYVGLKSPWWRKWVDGEPVPVIRGGKILEGNLEKERISVDELLMLLRQQKVFDAAQVETALLETSGQVSVLLKGEHQPATPRHLGLPAAGVEMPAVVIEDGQVMQHALRAIGRDRPWLERELAAQGVTSVGEAMLAQVDGQGNLYVDLYDDARIEPHRPHTAKLLGADLLKFEAEMETFAQDTRDPEARRLYADLAGDAARVRRALRGYIG
ncbi:MAG TPA: DUF421 domain-containing protein [Bacillota bacterium]